MTNHPKQSDFDCSAAVRVAAAEVIIDGCLIFYPHELAIRFEPNIDASHGVITNNTFIHSVPKWYQLRLWWKLIETICRHTRGAHE